ncbi:thiamine phosphate synthase [Helicobacter fennelliae]|uniref:Thiamin-phosphate pyrophosphorylase n=1 Tax=Helicobacter fennelliae MRY12-0050 TaxID=1325130 RepID=T1D3U0_9HELI|nr:thiamine phosphate synthase [Helicobacter fennelliae]GAD19891.1 thiamin-phosphate pyrophosphorylase [Helicobacter fennelliae MRY12-0050]STP08068.1 thiamine monophosphate synthase [Helicobacter fennelliae]
MSAKKLIAISDSTACAESILDRIAKLARAKIDMIILREKHLSEALYYDLAKEAIRICNTHHCLCVLHHFKEVALRLDYPFFHACFADLQEDRELKKHFQILGVSVHSQAQINEACKLQCDYVMIGHIFESSCKPSLRSRGLDFLRDCAKNSAIPLYAVGGINAENIATFQDIDIVGVCMRSSLMQCQNVESYLVACAMNLNPSF